MRLLPYPVTVITAIAGNRMRGITIGSFTSLSMEPSLVSFNVQRESQMHMIIEKADRFVVHIPSAGQQELCSRFALPDQNDEEQFEGVDYTIDEGFPPVISDTIAVIYCRIFKIIETGDHSLIIGEVEQIKRNREEPSILYCNGAYQSLEID